MSRIVVDLLAYDTGKPHWLSPEGRAWPRPKPPQIAEEVDQPRQLSFDLDMKERTPEELALIATMEQWEGRKLTETEIDFALKQARAVGEL